MMKLFIKLQVITIVLVLALTSCSSMEEVISKNPYLSQITNTECLGIADTDAPQNRGNGTHGSFEMIMDGTTAQCRFMSLEYPCDFEKVNINISFNDGVLTIVEYPSSDEADCRCEIDATFIINDLPDTDFMLKIYHGDTNGNFNIAAPKFSGRVRVKDGSFSTPYCCNDVPDVIEDIGQLIVYVAHDDSEIVEIDYSDYHITLTPECGMGWFTPKYSDVSWPIDVKVGTYTIGVVSPLISETATTETYYLGEVKNVKIDKDITTQITVNVKLTEFQKAMNPL